MVEQWPSKPEVKGSTPFGTDLVLEFMIFINVYRNTLLNRKNDVTYSKIFSFTSFDKINLLKLNMLATEKKFLRQYYKNFKKNWNNKKIFQESNTENFYGKFNWSKWKVRKFIYTHWFSKKDILPIWQDFNKKKIPLRRKWIIITRSLFKPELTFFSSDKLLVSWKKLWKYKQAFFFRNWFTIFFVKTLLDKYIGLNKFWRSLLLTVADLKMWAMLEHYDYFGLYSTSWNYISVHSSLQPKKSLFWLFTPFTKKWFLNIFYWKLYWKKFFKQKRYKFIWKFMELNFKSEGALERRMFRKLYLPLFGWKFEKTDPTQRFFFLSHYETYWKLLPNSTRSLFGFISPTTWYEKYLYWYPYHYSALFFWNFIKCLTDWKWTWFLNLRRYKVKFHHKNILFSLLNMFMSWVAGNWFTKWTDAHFVFPFMFAWVFLSKLFENKKNWLISSFVKDQSFSRTAKNYLLGRKKYAEVIWWIWLAFSLNWSSGKWFVWKVLEHESYSKLDYFKKAKYVWRDLVVESFTPFIRKDFVWYAEKFNYDPMNFNYKWLLWVLFPHQKIIEYNLLKSNNLYNYVKITKINRKFFSLLKIMWKGWGWRKKSLSDYKIWFPADFDFKAYAFNEHFTSFLHDIDVSQIFYTHPYENPYTYYHEIFFSCKKTWGFEFFFSKNLVLAATTIKFPILLTSRYYVEKFYFLIIKKADFKELCHLWSTVKNFTTAKNVAWITLYKRYLDQFSSVQQIYLFLIWKLEQNLMIHNDLYKNSILNQLLVWFEGEKFSSNSKIFLLVYLLHFFEYFNKKVINPKLLNSSILRFIFWKFFFFTHWTKIFFRPSMMVVKPYFTQTLRTIKWYPITHFRLIGTKKTSSTGILTALVNSLNVFSAPGFFNLTLNWNNPYYFSQDRKKDQLYTVSSQLVLDKFFNSDLWEKFAPILFDDMYEEITFSNYFIVNAWFTNSQFLLYMWKILYEIYPGNILDKDYFWFWYNYILVFDNQSTWVLTSKMRWNMSMYSYFIGPLTITLYETNWKLLTRVSTTEHWYLVTMLVLARLEVAQLKRLEALFPFQFDYKKFMLGRKHRFLWPYEEANFFFF